MLETILFEHLKANVPDVEERVYTYLLPQECTYPAIAILEISNKPDYDFSGPNGDEQSHYQISVFAKTYTEARTVADAVKASMHMPIVGIQAALQQNCSPSYEAEIELYHIAFDFLIQIHFPVL